MANMQQRLRSTLRKCRNGLKDVQEATALKPYGCVMPADVRARGACMQASTSLDNAATSQGE